jgi:acetate kinase
MSAPVGYILALNAGSSSLKFALFETTSLACVLRGSFGGLDSKLAFKAQGTLLEQGMMQLPDVASIDRTIAATVQVLVHWLGKLLPEGALQAIGHRVVHGGRFTEPKLVDPDSLTYLEALVPLAPMHQPTSLKNIQLFAYLHPNIPQIACFDTMFHATVPDLHRRFALPRVWYDRGVQRYGFHGLSYEYVAGQLRQCAPAAFSGNTIIAHMGSGASLCALKNGKSFETSMGFSALDGLMMGTRPGTLDAGVMLYFMQVAGMDAAAIEHLLYRESGLLGVSGISADMKTLLASTTLTAREAIELFCLRITREAGALVSMLGGLDAFVFTGGIGEHSPAIRKSVAQNLGWAGLRLDEAANAAGEGAAKTSLLSTPQSGTSIWMMPTDEEAIIAQHTLDVLSKT